MSRPARAPHSWPESELIGRAGSGEPSARKQCLRGRFGLDFRLLFCAVRLITRSFCALVDRVFFLLFLFSLFPDFDRPRRRRLVIGRSIERVTGRPEVPDRGHSARITAAFRRVKENAAVRVYVCVCVRAHQSIPPVHPSTLHTRTHTHTRWRAYTRSSTRNRFPLASSASYFRKPSQHRPVAGRRSVACSCAEQSCRRLHRSRRPRFFLLVLSSAHPASFVRILRSLRAPRPSFLFCFLFRGSRFLGTASFRVSIARQRPCSGRRRFPLASGPRFFAPARSHSGRRRRRRSVAKKPAAIRVHAPRATNTVLPVTSQSFTQVIYSKHLRKLIHAFVGP